MEIGDSAKGFRFGPELDKIPDDSGLAAWSSGPVMTSQMLGYVGVPGKVEAIGNDWFSIRFADGKCYGYPLMEYMALQREERLKELGIEK